MVAADLHSSERDAVKISPFVIVRCFPPFLDAEKARFEDLSPSFFPWGDNPYEKNTGFPELILIPVASISILACSVDPKIYVEGARPLLSCFITMRWSHSVGLEDATLRQVFDDAVHSFCELFEVVLDSFRGRVAVCFIAIGFMLKGRRRPSFLVVSILMQILLA